MKKACSFILCVIFAFTLSAQTTTVTIRPDGSTGKDALIDGRTAVANTNYGTSADFASWAWTNSGTTIARSLVDFDLSTLPANAVITDARISLYCNTTSAITQLHSGDNASYLERITDSWNENTVTYANQPTTTITNRVNIAASTSSTQNYLNIDVTQLVTDMKNNPASSYGFMLKLQTEAIYRSMIFASSDHTDPTKRPSLTITYSLVASCPHSLTLQPNAVLGKDAMIDSRTPVSGTNYGTTTDFASWAWTNGGNTVARSLLQFDISGLPTGATVLEARLSLYCNTTSGITQLSSGTNESYLQRITTTWDENTVTWNNQPTSTSLNQVSLATSLATTQDYLNIDVKQLIIDMLQKPDSSFGFLLKLQAETPYRSMILSSSDHADASKRPKLVICYSAPNTITLLGPVGSEKILQGTNANITWANGGVTGNVGLQYSTDNGQNWINIITSVPAIAGSYTWAVPMVNSNLCRVRIRSVSDSTVMSSSTNPFSILPAPSLTLVSPAGGENWFNTLTKNISWTGANSIKIKIEYTSNDSTWTTLADNVNTSDSTWPWHLPAIVSTKVKVKISDKSFPSFSSTSGLFTLRTPPAIAVISPNGGETWNASTTHNITWSASNSSLINIGYSINDSLWINIATNIPATNASYAWHVPAMPSSGVKIRISDAGYPQYFDKSNSAFTISIPANPAILSPNGSEVLPAGMEYTITWDPGGYTNNVKLQYSTDSGSTWNSIANNILSSGSFDWNTPMITSNRCLVRITDVTDSMVRDISNNVFTIVPLSCPGTLVLQPGAGVGKDALLDNRTGISSTNFGTLSDFAAWAWTNGDNTIARSVIQFDLTGIPAGAIVTGARLSFYCNTSSGVSQLNAGLNATYIRRVTTAWDENAVTWDNQPATTSLHQVSLAKSASKTQNYLNMDVLPLVQDMMIHPDSSFGFMIMLQNEQLYRSLILSSSDHPDSTRHPRLVICYEIASPAPSVHVSTPNGGETWLNNRNQTISWTSSNVSKVTLHYSINNGANWTFIDSVVSTSGGGMYSWFVDTAVVSGNARIKIEDANDVSVADISDSTFSIVPDTTTGTGYVLKDILFSIYPNPAQGIFNVHYQNEGKPWSCRIYSISGRLMESRQELTASEVSINHDEVLSNKGVYIIELTTSEGLTRKRVILY